jgi:ubiquinone/menaquinone biosynthesis C-methylase UbiE
MNHIDYNDRLHVRYHKGRALDESVMQLWREALHRWVVGREEMTILDLGSGTGRFSPLLADTFDAQVVGVEPSDKMRAVAETESRHPQVRFLTGSAEHIPLADNACDLAWLSQIVHHLPDVDAAAREIARVLTESGVLIVRNNFSGRLVGCARYYEFFPTGLAVDEKRHPSVEHIQACFHRHGFRLAAFEAIEQMESASLQEYADRIQMRTYSTLELISEQEYEAGLAALQAAASREQEPQPVLGRVDVLVFERE